MSSLVESMHPLLARWSFVKAKAARSFAVASAGASEVKANIDSYLNVRVRKISFKLAHLIFLFDCLALLVLLFTLS